MLTCTTMVLAILVETTSPILVARRPCVCVLLVVSAIYFFLAFALALLVFLAAGLAVFAAGFPAAAVFFLAGLALVAAAVDNEASAATGLAWLSRPSSFSRWIVLIRATSLRSPRTSF